MADEDDIMVEFDVDQEEPLDLWVTYLKFIQEVRERLAGIQNQTTHESAILPPERVGQPPARWLNVLLRANQHELSIRLRIRTDNLYLIGFQLHDSEEWLELVKPGGSHLITGSTPIGCSYNYPELGSKAKRSVECIPIGQEQLIRSISDLNTITTIQNRAYNLLVMMVMICESIRFTRVSAYIATLFGSVVPEPWVYTLTHDWGTYSSMLQEADFNKKLTVPRHNKMTFMTFLQIAAALAVVKYDKCFHRPPRSSSLDMNTVVDDGQYRLGKPLVEVFGVYVTDIDKEDEGELYGTVSIRGGLISQYLYNRTRDNYESIKPGNTALLIGPVQSIWAFDSFSIDVDLMDKDLVSSDDRVSKGQVFWNVSDNLYDTPLDKDVNGEYGSVTVRYIVFRDAVEATVEVTLINWDGENTADVYGLLTARTTTLEIESVLFRKSSSQRIKVRPGQVIPLARRVVAVPSNSCLTVRADLWDYYNIISSNAQIVKGTAEFSAYLSGSEEKRIKGQYGDIKVKVTWSNS